MCWICTMRGADPATMHAEGPAKASHKQSAAQIEAVVRRLQGLVMSGAFARTDEAGNHVAELGTLVRPCGCHVVVVTSCAVLYFAAPDGREGWGDRCPHDLAPLLSPPAPSAIIRQGASLH